MKVKCNMAHQDEKIIAKEMLNRTCRISCLPNIQNSRGKSSDNTNDKNDKNDGKSQANNTELSSAGDTTDDKFPSPPTNCCMSGCANCVWIQYAEELSEKLQNGSDLARDIIMKEVQDTNMRSFLEMELRMLKSKN